MSRLLDIFKNAARNPIEAIEVVVAFCVLLAGLNLLSPFYDNNLSAGTASAFAENRTGIALYGIFAFVVPSAPILLAVFLERFRTPEWRARGTFMLFVALLFSCILRLIVFGIFPPIFLYIAGLVLVSGVCYLYRRARL